MKLSKSFFYTLREDVKDEESRSGNLLIRSGYIKKVSAGIFMYMPIGLRSLDKIKKIIKEEMDNAGAEELLMPSLIPAEVYEACGRVEAFGKDMFNLYDRNNHHMVLGPTHEELFTIAASSKLKSYKDLPFTIYQQADKFRDEPRPRLGLIRVKEFIMKDAYSFDRDEKSQDESYRSMFNAYKRIFDRIGLDYKIVNASVGAMGGSLSEEFQAVTDVGEDILVLCDSCNYASNLEVSNFEYEDVQEDEKEKELVETPNAKTIDDVCKFLNLDIKHSVKALLMHVDNELTIFFIRGDRELNESKALKLLGGKEIGFADDEMIAKSSAVPGFTGPIDLTGCKIVIDDEIKHMKNFCVGANKEGYHFINVNINDFKYDISGDIATVVEGDKCPECGGNIYFRRGIEVGNTFKLGDHYTKDLEISYLDENNKECFPLMGSYGIGPGRILAASVEQNNDEYGMILPMAIAPYQVSIVLIDSNDDTQVNIANKIHDELEINGVEVLMDDRDERPGVKFNDMDLIGIPIRITVGKKALDNIVEFKLRKEKEVSEIRVDEVIELTLKTIKDELK